MQQHSDKLIRGKTPQLPIIAQVFGHKVLVKEDTQCIRAEKPSN